MRRLASVTGLVLLTAACARPPVAPPPAAKGTEASDDAASPVTPPARPSPPPADPTAALQAASAAFAKAFVTGHVTNGGFGTSGDFGGPEKLVYYCDLGDAVGEIGDVSIATSEREALARYVAVVREDLRRSGYPEGMWRAPVDAYQAERTAALARVDPVLRLHDPADPNGERLNADPSYRAYEDGDGPARKRMLDAMEAKRMALGVALPPVRDDAGCGAAEQPYRVATTPAGGRVWLQTKFAADVCRAEGHDPWNREGCRWTEIDPRQTRYLSGTYAYLATWPDQRHGRGTMVFEGEGDDDGAPQTRTVRPD